ncbi:unnamed protein product [Stenotrophomonas maltophilia]|nr:unnamed protein product [Stenotrophomonas maltophilia]
MPGSCESRGRARLARGHRQARGRAQRGVVGWVGTWREVSHGLDPDGAMIANQTHSELVE